MKISAIAAGVLTLAAASGAVAQDRIKFQYWYGLTGALGDVMQEHCTEFNKAQAKYEAVCTGQGGYDKAEQNAIAAYRANQQPTICSSMMPARSPSCSRTPWFRLSSWRRNTI